MSAPFHHQRQIIGLLAGPPAFTVLTLLEPPQGMQAEAWRVSAMTLWMAIWWISEATPIPVTAMPGALLSFIIPPDLGQEVSLLDRESALRLWEVIILSWAGFALACVSLLLPWLREFTPDMPAGMQSAPAATTLD